MSKDSCAIVIITDSNFVLAVYILVASIRFHGVTNPISILGIALEASEKELLSQFDAVTVVDSEFTSLGNRTSLRAIANICKREAIMAVKDLDVDYIALLDGDCIITGNITPYLYPDKAGIYLRIRSASEDSMIFKTRYDDDDESDSDDYSFGEYDDDRFN